MEVRKPDWGDYASWSISALNVDLGKGARERYETNAKRVREQVGKSKEWNGLMQALRELDSQVSLKTSEPLLGHPELELGTKSFDSMVRKCFRWNCKDNEQWPEPPRGAWTTPENVFEKMPDIVRGRIVVRFMDGVTAVEQAISQFAGPLDLKPRTTWKAFEDGYYASHIALRFPVSIVQKDWSERSIELPIELQISTQLKETIGGLLHRLYEKDRMQVAAKSWFWDYQSEQFKISYLGHVMHYLDGMLVETRELQRRKND